MRLFFDEHLSDLLPVILLCFSANDTEVYISASDYILRFQT